jgi:hypothetical protein
MIQSCGCKGIGGVTVDERTNDAAEVTIQTNHTPSWCRCPQQPDEGILIPSFLRELFGVDFVPSPHPCRCIDNNNSNNTNDDVEETTNKKLQTDKLETESTQLQHLHLQQIVIDTVTTLDDCHQQPPHQTPCKSTKTPRKLSSFMKRSMRRQRSSSSKVHSAIEYPLESTTRRNRIQKYSLLSPSSKVSLQADATPERTAYTKPTSCTPLASEGDGRMVIPFLQKQLQELEQHQNCLASIQQISKHVEQRAQGVALHMTELEEETARLQSLLKQCIHRYENEKENLHQAHATLAQLEDKAEKAARAVETSIRSLHSGISATILPANQIHQNDNTFSDEENLSTPFCNPITQFPPQSESSSCKTRGLPKTPRSNAFMRVNDFPPNDSPDHQEQQQQQELSSLSSHSSSWNSVSPLNKDLSMEHVFHLDQNLSWILDQLFELGYGIVTDESDRFQPTRETARLLKHESSSSTDLHASDWPVRPWHAAHGAQVLTWIGKVDHTCFGHDWPVVKARGIVHTSPRALLEFLMDSRQVQKYVKFSQGREDVLILQDGIDTLPCESEFGFAGTAKIVRSLLKPRMLPKSIELL